MIVVYLVYLIFAIIAIAFASIIALELSRPSTFRIERDIEINAKPEAIYAILSDFHRSGCWSPWENKDPNMKRMLGGAESGKGAIYEWDGDKNVGHGRQEIIEATPYSKIEIQLDFFRPFKGRNTTQFLLEPAVSSTRVRWVMFGPVNFIVRVLCINLDKMVGKDFEQGLSNLKGHHEA